LKGEERVCHVTEADTLGPQAPVSAKQSFASGRRKHSLRRSLSEKCLHASEAVCVTGSYPCARRYE